MRSRNQISQWVIALTGVVVAASCVPATNPFDPDAPPEVQAKGRLLGRVVLVNANGTAASLTAELDDITVKLLDADGRPVPDGNADRISDVSGARDVTDGNGSGAFAFDDLAPGVYSLAILDTNGALLPYRAPAIVPVTVFPGADANIGNLTFVSDAACAPGKIVGHVALQGAAQATRTVSLYQRTGTSTTLTSAVISADGEFAFDCLTAPALYALTAESDGFTPDFRLDVNVTTSQPQTFVGDQALVLHPVSAVLQARLGDPAFPIVLGRDGSVTLAGDTAPLAVLAFINQANAELRMRLSTRANFQDDDGADLPFIAHNANHNQLLPNVEGPISIFAQFQVRSVDNSFVFTSDTFTFAVTRDASPPEVLALSLPGLRVVDGVFVTRDNSVGVTIDAQENVTAIDGVELTIDGVGVIEPVLSSGGRVLLPRTVSLTSEGEHEIAVRVFDRANNASAPVTVRVRRDSTNPALDIVVTNADNGLLRTRQATLSLTDTIGDIELIRVDLMRGDGSIEALVGDGPFVPSMTLSLPTPADGEPVVIRVTAADATGNITAVDSPQLTLNLRARLAGFAVKSAVPDLDADHAGVIVVAKSALGATLASTVTAADGSYLLANVPEGTGIVVEATAVGYAIARAQAITVVGQATGAVAVDIAPLSLALLTGTLTVVAKKAESEAANTGHGGIAVRAVLTGGRAFATQSFITADDGSVRFTGLPATLAGETYSVQASLQDRQPASINDVTLTAGATTFAGVLTLGAVTGAFDLCAGSSGACVLSTFINTDDVRVRLRGVAATAIRARAGDAFLPSTPEDDLPFIDITTPGSDVVNVAGLPEGTVNVFVQVKVGDVVSEVLATPFVRDTTPPAAPAVVVRGGNGSLDARFTRFNTVEVVVDGDAGIGTVAPLDRARVTVDGQAPVTLCDDERACTVALPLDAGAVVEGKHDLAAVACDQAGNCSAPAAAFIIHDRTPPSTDPTPPRFTLSAAGAVVDSGGVLVLRSPLYAGAIHTGTSNVVDENNAAIADVFGYRIGFLASGADAALVPLVTPAPISSANVIVPPLQITEDVQTVFANLVDAAGNVATQAIAVAVRVDATPPDALVSLTRLTGTPTNLSNTSTVRLTITPGVEAPSTVEIDANNDGVFESGALSFPLVSDVIDLDVGAVPAPDGTAIVNVRLADLVGNITPRTASIQLDRTPASVVSVTCAACRVAGGEVLSISPTGQETLLVEAIDNVAVDRLRVTVNGNSTEVLSTSTAIVGLTKNDTNTVVVEALDRAGNIPDGARTKTITIRHDDSRPEFTVTINGGAAQTNNPDVTVTIQTADTDIVGMRLSSTPTFTGPVLPFTPATRFDLPLPDDTRSVFVELTDSAGNTHVQSDDIFLDQTGPTGTFEIRRANNTASEVTNTTSVRLRIDTNEPGLTVRFDNDLSSCGGAGSFAPLTQGVQTFAHTLVSGASGPRTVTACVRDLAGNITALSDQIVLDLDDPVLNGAPECRSCNIVDDLAFTNSTTISIGLDIAIASQDVIEARSAFQTTCSITSDCLVGEVCEPFPAEASEPRCTQVHPDVGNVVVAMPNVEGPMIADFVIVDLAGNISDPTSLKVVRDITPPQAVIFDVSEGGVTRFSTISVADITFVDNSATFGLSDVDTFGTFQASTLLTFADSPTFTYRVGTEDDVFPVALHGGDGEKLVRVRFADNAGNVAVSDGKAVLLDTTPPTQPRFADIVSITNANTVAVSLSTAATDSSGSGLRLVRPYDIIGDTGACPSGTVPAGTACQWSGVGTILVPLVFNQDNRIRIQAVDRAGNISAQDIATVTQDNVNPTAPPFDVEGRSGSVTVAWAASDADVVRYEVNYGFAKPPNGVLPAGGSFALEGPSPVSVQAPQRQLSLTGLSNNTPFFVHVTAIDRAGRRSSVQTSQEALPNPVAPKLVFRGRGMAATQLIAKGPRLYAIVENRGNHDLCVFPVVEASVEEELGCVRIEPFDRAHLHGRFIYLTNTDLALPLRVVDVSQPSSMSVTPLTLETGPGSSSAAYDLAIVGNSAFISRQTTSGSPGQVAMLRQPAQTSPVVIGPQLVVTSKIDGNDPTAPFDVPFSKAPRVFSNGHFFLTTNSGGGRAFILIPGENPQLTTTRTAEMNPFAGLEDGKFEGETLYAATPAGLAIYRLQSFPTPITIERGRILGFACNTIDVTPGYAYCNDHRINSSSSIVIIDVHDPAQPTIAGRVTRGSEGIIRALDVEENLLFAATADGDIVVYELWKPSRMTQGLVQPGLFVDGYLDGQSLIASNFGLSVSRYDLQDPLDPEFRTDGRVINLLQGAADKTRIDQWARLTVGAPSDDAGTVMAIVNTYDLNSTEVDRRVKVVPAEGPCSRTLGSPGKRSRDIVVHGNVALVATNAGTVETWALGHRNTTTTMNPRCLASINVPNVGRLSDVVDNGLYATTTSGGVFHIDVSNYESPVANVLGTAPTLGVENDGFGEVENRGSFLVVSRANNDGTGLLATLDASDGKALRSLSTRTGSIAVAGRYIVGADGTRFGADNAPSFSSGMSWYRGTGDGSFSQDAFTQVVTAGWQTLVSGPVVISVSAGTGIETMIVAR